MSNVTKRRQLIDTITEGNVSFPILGHIVWWNLRNLDLTQADFAKKLTEAGINPERYARPHNYRSSFIRALQHMQQDRIIRRVSETPRELVYQFTTEKQVRERLGLRLDYEYETKLRVDKNIYRDTRDFGSALVDGDKEIKRVVVNLFHREKTRYRSADITRYVMKIFNDNADVIALRDQGNVYFVPSSFRGLVNNVHKLVTSLSNESKFEWMPMPNTESSRSVVRNSFSNEINNLFKQLKEEIEKGEGGEKWVVTKLANIEHIMSRVSLYSDVLEERDRTKMTADFDGLKAMLTKAPVLV